MTTKTTARVRDGIHHAAAEEAQRNWLQDLVSRCFTCPALKQSAVAYQQIPRHLQGLPPAHKKNREPSLCGDDSLLVESSSPSRRPTQLFRCCSTCIFAGGNTVNGISTKKLQTQACQLLNRPILGMLCNTHVNSTISCLPTDNSPSRMLRTHFASQRRRCATTQR